MNSNKNLTPSPTEFTDPAFSRSVCSATDCTGLIPALPDSEAELEAYDEMYQFCYTQPDDPR